MSMSLAAATTAAHDLFDGGRLDWGTTIIAAVMLASPAWLPTLKETSEIAGAAAPLLGAGLIIYKGYLAWRESAEAKASSKAETAAKDGEKVLGNMSQGLGKLATASGRVAGWTLGLFGIVALIGALFATSGSAKASPAVLPAATTAARKKSADGAGDDGNAAPPDSNGAEPAWLQLARGEIGVEEWAGKKNNPRVLQYYVDAGHPEIKADEVSWCAAFTCAMLERAGYASPKTLAARDFCDWGREARAPYVGCVAVFWRTSPKGWQGHVGFYVGETPTHILVLGGNQSDGVTVAKMPKSRLLGYREPRPLATSGTVKGAALAVAGSVGTAATTGAELAGLAAARPEGEPGTLDSLSSALAPLAAYSRPIALACAVLACAGGLYALWHRMQIRKDTGR